MDSPRALQDDVIVQDSGASKLEFSVLASMRMHSLEPSNGLSSAVRQSHRKHLPSIATIQEDEDLAEPDELAKESPMIGTRSLLGAMPSDLRGSNGAAASREEGPSSPFAQPDSQRQALDKQVNAVQADERRSSSDSVLLLDTESLRTFSSGSEKRSPSRTPRGSRSTRSTLRLNTRSRSTDTELSPRTFKSSPKPKTSPTPRISKSYHHRPPRARRKNFAMDFTNDPSHTSMPV